MNGSLPLSGGLKGAQFSLQASGANLAGVLPAFGVYSPPAARFGADLQLTTGTDQITIRRLDATLADARLTGHGQLALDTAHTGSRLVVSCKGPRLSALGKIDGMILPDEPFQIDAGVTQTGSALDVQDLKAGIGPGELSGHARVAFDTPPRLDLDVSLRGLALDRFLPGSGPATQTRPAAGAARPQRLIPDTPVPLDFPARLDGRFQIAGSALSWPDPVFSSKNLLRELALDARLDKGRLNIGSLRIAGDRGEARMQGTITQSQGRVTASLSGQLARFRFGVLSVGESLDTLPAHELDINLDARGRSWHELAASLNGRFRLQGGKGVSRNAGLEKTLGAFGNELFRSINPFSGKEGSTRIECTAAAGDLVGGVVRLDPGFVVRTDKIDIAASGRIDLGSERLDVQFHNTPREGLGLSAAGLVKPFVKVGGTLASPGIELDTTRAVVSGTAAVASGGVTLLLGQLVEHVKSISVDPCKAIIEAGTKATVQ